MKTSFKRENHVSTVVDGFPVNTNTRKPFKWLLTLLALVFTASFTACSDDDKEPDNGGQKPDINVYDDLAYFQNAIIEVDSLGDMLSRSYGEVLYENEPDHLYIGVDNLTEAETMFREWIAPDIELSATVPTAGGLTCPLTDAEGKPQGTIYFKPGSGSSVAEVTASSDTELKHFRRITFLLNSAWPYNESIYQQYTEGDIITFTPSSDTFCNIYGTPRQPLTDKDQTLNWVCIRQGGKGVKPMFCAITNSDYPSSADHVSILLRESSYCPAESTAKTISKRLNASWDMYVELFDKAGCGKLKKSGAYWIDKNYWSWGRYYCYIEYASGKVDAYRTYEKDLPYLLKIDWLDDSAIRSTLVGTDGCSAVQGHEKYVCLFDRMTNTKWCTYKDYKKKSINGTDNVWFVDFQANAPIYPIAYKMTTGNDCEKFKGRNPKAWKLYGRGDITDDWVLIDEVTNGGMADVNCKTYSYTVGAPDYYMYFRLEISSCVSGATMQLSEFSFVTKEPDED